MSVAEVRAEAERHFQHWFPDAASFEAAAGFLIQRGDLRLAAFLLHQTTERLYHCVLLVVTLYSPKLHRLNRLRPLAEGVDARLIAAWPRDTRFARRCFARLDRAYVDARYSPHYEITGEELAWLVERIGSFARSSRRSARKSSAVIRRARSGSRARQVRGCPTSRARPGSIPL
ncbi:hypothetical protein GCM10025880_64530 [Methylorubrum aminovorans]|nr:hypothetical protein GCM10025880_64530 [Methylorubrum aminovorans]